MIKGEIVLVQFPFTDLRSEKLRPALVLAPENKEGDVLLAFITTKLEKRESTDVFIVTEIGGLKQDSLIKLNKLMTLNKHIILGKIGDLPKQYIDEVNKKLRNFLKI